jgi:ribonuclease-3
LEALIGYIYIDLGVAIVEDFIEKYIYVKLETIRKNPVKSYKTMIQEIVQKKHKVIPEYKDIEEKKDDKGNIIEYKSEIYTVGKKVSE